MNNALEAMKDLPSTRQEADRFIQLLVAGVKNGETDPLRLRLFLKHIERICSEVSAACEEDILREAEKYGTRFELMDAEIQIKVNGSRFSYENTQDPVIQRLKEEAERISKQVKEREKFLQGLPENGQEIVDEETGDVVRIYKPQKVGGKTGLSITIGGPKA